MPFAVVIMRNAGVKLFVAETETATEGLIYSPSSKSWSKHPRPFDGPQIGFKPKQVETRDEAVRIFRQFMRSYRAAMGRK